MDQFAGLVIGFGTAFTVENLAFCFLGVLLGTMVGVLPGLGPTATIAMLLPITFTMSPTASLIMMAGIYYGSQYGGSTTAILMNVPGEASSAVTAIDGYRMAQSGRAGPALAIAAIGSLFAGTVGTLVLALFAAPLTSIALKFEPQEYVALAVLGLIASVILARGSVIKALAMVAFGLIVATVGTDLYTGTSRFTLGFPELYDGMSVVAIAVGTFGIAEIMRQLTLRHQGIFSSAEIGRVWPSRKDFRDSAGPIARGSLIGAVLGILPGGGALLASFASYATEKKLSATPERFGHGAIEGVAGPESANNAAAQTSFIPMLALGIPSNVVMAMMIGAMMMHNIVPGPNVATRDPQLFWGLIVSMWIGNVFLVILNLPLVGVWVRLLKVPYRILFPGIMIFCTIGAYTLNNNAFDLYVMVMFGVGGYLLIRAGCEPAPFIIGVVLGPILEEQFRRSMILSLGDFTTFFTRPISLTLLIMAAALLFIVTKPAVKRRRTEIFNSDD
jgi:TctA family transporter